MLMCGTKYLTQRATLRLKMHIKNAHFLRIRIIEKEFFPKKVEKPLFFKGFQTFTVADLGLWGNPLKVVGQP